MVGLTLTDLMDYTVWEREQWHLWLTQHGDEVLKIPAGPHGDGRFTGVGDVVRHIFSAEKRYVERLTSREMTDTSTIPSDKVDALFAFGRQSRNDLEKYVAELPPQEWDAVQEFSFMNKILRATPRKLIVHVLMHEIRHWAQISTVLRLNGFPCDFQDFLFSPVMGGEFRRE